MKRITAVLLPLGEQRLSIIVEAGVVDSTQKLTPPQEKFVANMKANELKWYNDNYGKVAKIATQFLRKRYNNENISVMDVVSRLKQIIFIITPPGGLLAIAVGPFSIRINMDKGFVCGISN